MIQPIDTCLQATDSSLACPRCRGRLSRTDEMFLHEPINLSCDRCSSAFPIVAGIPDLRLESDRYLSLEAERAKAERLATIASESDLRGVAEAYYAMTPDPDPVRCRRFLKHILGADVRGEAFAATLPSSGRVLEVGCGTGGLLLAAHRRGLKIEGTDIAARWLVVARRRLDDARVQVPLIAASAERLPWRSNRFDLVVADSLVEHLDRVDFMMNECWRVLKPGGTLRLWSPNRYSVLADPHVRLWGVNHLPRQLGQAYARLRRGPVWLPRSRSAWEIARLARAAGFDRIEVRAPRLDPAWLEQQGSYLLELYGLMSKTRPLNAILRAIGPQWELVASKRGKP